MSLRTASYTHAPDAVEALNSAGAALEYDPAFIAEKSSFHLLNALLDAVEFDSPEASRIRKPFSSDWVEIPRRQSAYGDPGTHYRFSGTTVAARPWIAPLAELRDRVSERIEAPLNFVLVSYYRDGSDYMGWHSDDEKDLGDEPLVASVSLGAARDFRFRSRADRKRAFTMTLGNGSLLVMRHPTNRDWQHQLPKRGGSVPGRIAPRLNLTFRRVLAAQTGDQRGL